MSTKNVSLDDVMKCFAKGVENTKVISTGFLPENCLSVRISDKLKSTVIWHPVLKCDFTLFKSTYENFPIPRIVFGLDIDTDGKVRGYRMAVVADEKPKPATVLYEYPFSNVYPSTNICIGAANTLPVYKQLHTVASLPNHILSIPNNDHNYKRANNELHLGYRELLDHMRDKEPSYYYENILIPRRDKKTLQDFIDCKIR